MVERVLPIHLRKPLQGNAVFVVGPEFGFVVGAFVERVEEEI